TRRALSRTSTPIRAAARRRPFSLSWPRLEVPARRGVTSNAAADLAGQRAVLLAAVVPSGTVLSGNVTEEDESFACRADRAGAGPVGHSRRGASRLPLEIGVG